MCEGRPEIEICEVGRWAEQFGLCLLKDGQKLAEVKELPAYEDLNFYIKTENGQEYVLKAHNGFLPSGTTARLFAQNRLIDRLHEKGLPVPEVVKTPDGLSVVPMAEPGSSTANQKAHVRVLTWLQGQTIPNEVPKSSSFLGTVGELCGQITEALAGFEDDDTKWDWDWNMKNVASVCSAKLSYVTDPARRALAERFIASYEKFFTDDRIAKLPHSVIHSDVNDTNILFDGEEVVGLIDFGDSIYSCTIFELGIAAGYYSLAQEDPLWVFCEVLRGYLRRVMLDDDELSALYHACYGRVLLSVCMSAQACAAEPDNEYLAHTSAPGWAVLSKLSNATTEEAFECFRSVREEVNLQATGDTAVKRLSMDNA